MKTAYTAAGTPVIEMSTQEWFEFLDREAHDYGFESYRVFAEAYRQGELEDGDLAVDSLLPWLRSYESGRQPEGEGKLLRVDDPAPVSF